MKWGRERRDGETKNTLQIRKRMRKKKNDKDTKTKGNNDEKSENQDHNIQHLQWPSITTQISSQSVHERLKIA